MYLLLDTKQLNSESSLTHVIQSTENLTDEQSEENKQNACQDLVQIDKGIVSNAYTNIKFCSADHD